MEIPHPHRQPSSAVSPRFSASFRVCVILQGRVIALSGRMDSTHYFLYSLNLVGSPHLCGLGTLFHQNLC
ncbi:mCG148370 [Mus musculus]|nr:mCG148370 [Mus musculus]